MTARTEEQLIARTLAAACEMTGATFAAARDPDGTSHWHGDPERAARLGLVGRTTNVGLAIGTGLATSTGLTTNVGDDPPNEVTVRLGSTLVVVAYAEPRQGNDQARALLALLVAHALAARDRLRELDRLSRQADSDPLTGLPHKRPFARRLLASSPGRTAIIAMDVDDFKDINDQYGHQAGDRTLLALAGALRAALRDGDHLYRIGGDEFAAVIDIHSRGELVTIARRLLNAARQVGQTVSLGAALQAKGETGLDTLGRADRALYQAKRAGRDSARLAPAPSRLRRPLEWQARFQLRQGLAQDLTEVTTLVSAIDP